MSVIYCHNCCEYVDTDFDAEHEEMCGKDEEDRFDAIDSLKGLTIGDYKLTDKYSEVGMKKEIKQWLSVDGWKFAEIDGEIYIRKYDIVKEMNKMDKILGSYYIGSKK